MPNKFVYLKRALPFIHDQINSEAMQEQLSMTKRSIGAYYVSQYNPQLGTGLTEEEKKFLLPELVNIPASSAVEFREAVKKFYTDITTHVPGNKVGLELNIGLEDNSKPVAADNMPVNLMDYIRFRHAVGYQYTAPSVTAAKGNRLIQYYIEDPETQLELQAKGVETRDAAFTEYLRIKNDKDIVSMVLLIMRNQIKKEEGKPPVNVRTLTEKQRMVVLNQLVEMRPERFYEVVTDSDLKPKFFIEECLDFGVLGRIGNEFVDIEDQNTPLGNTIKEVVTFIKKETETQRLNRLRASLKEKKESKRMIAV